MAHLLHQVHVGAASRPIRRGPRHHPPLEIIDSVLLLEEADDFAAASCPIVRGPRHHPPPEFIGSVIPHVDVATASRPIVRGPRHHPPRGRRPVLPLDEDITILPLLSAGYFTYFGHQGFIPPPEENYYYYYPAMPSPSGINHGRQETSNLEWARVEVEEEETMILGGSEDDGVMSDGLSKKIIGELLKTRKPCPEDKEKDKVCTVCLDDLNGQENIGILDCQHEYHATCIAKWLTKKNFCPLCRAIAL